MIDGEMSDEKALHRRFDHLRVRKRAEWFRLDDELAKFIAKNAKDRPLDRTERELEKKRIREWNKRPEQVEAARRRQEEITAAYQKEFEAKGLKRTWFL